MRISGVHTRVMFALAALSAICQTVSVVQAFDQAPQKIPPDLQSNPVKLILELEASLASPEANSSKVLLPADPTRRVMGGRAPASGGCGDGVCDGEENCATCPNDCGECACANVYPGNCDDAQIGISGGPALQECNLSDCWDRNGNGICDLEDEDSDSDGNCDVTDCSWVGLAFPIDTGGGIIDTLSLQLSSNDAGGDLYLTGDAGCRPDISNILATLCCGLSGLEAGIPLELYFDPATTSADEPTWVLFVGRTNSGGRNNLGFFDGSISTSYGLSRSNLEPSLPSRAFANLSARATRATGPTCTTSAAAWAHRSASDSASRAKTPAARTTAWPIPIRRGHAAMWLGTIVK